MTGNGQKFGLLLWKNYLIQKRKKVLTVFEIALPTFFALILVLIRMRVDQETKPPEIWRPCDEVSPFGGWNQLPPFTMKTWNMAFAPDNAVVRRIMETFANSTNLPPANMTALPSEAELVDFLMFANSTVNHTETYLGGVVFTNSFPSNNTFPDHISYKIRLSSTPRLKQFSAGEGGDNNWKTGQTFPVFQVLGPRQEFDPCGGTPGYAREGFMALEHAVNLALVKEVGGDAATDLLDGLNVNVQRHPYPSYFDDEFVLVIQTQFPLVLLLSFVLVALNIAKSIVHEKERKLKESMKMMGLNNWLHWSAWFSKYFLFLLISVLIMTVLFCIPTGKGAVINETSPFIVFIFLVSYSIATISFCFAVSVFFSKANSGAAAGGILHFVFYIPYFFLQPQYQTLTRGEKLSSCIAHNVAMAYGGQLLGMFEGTGEGVQFSNIMQGVSVDDDFSMFDVIMMLLIDALVYALITWYVEAVFPGEYGVPQKWYFLVLPSYWCGTRPTEKYSRADSMAKEQDAEFFEMDPVGMRPGISIRNLRKEFKSGGPKKKVAVEGMKLDMYEGQITALLGHNGAGKTTTMSMLTGFIPPTSGTAYVNGYDIREDLASVRDGLGLCPQHDVLFDTLTVEEHLQFFGKLKGCGKQDLQKDVDEMLKSIHLENKRHQPSSKLSGGMKRKLSVGIALIGGSKIVILDEPSSGLDPNARRQMWSLLQQNRAGRTMVLTTHFMDEADLLGDRIAIMADGVVKCCGSSLFLKNKYGAGYHMTLVQEPSCNVGMVTAVIQKHVPEGKLESNVGAELSYILPHDMAHKFEGLFTEIDENQQELGISGYGASVTTMEEVFLRVGEDNTHEENGVQNTNGENGIQNSNGVNPNYIPDQGNITRSRYGTTDLPLNIVKRDVVDEPTTVLPSSGASNQSHGLSPNFLRTASFTHEVIMNTGMPLLRQQFQAMFIKRVLHTLRNKVVTIAQLIVPLLFTIMALSVDRVIPEPQDSKPLDLSVNSFGNNFVVYSVGNNSISQADLIGQKYANQFMGNDKTTVEFVNADARYKNNPNMTAYLLEKGSDNLASYNLKYQIGLKVTETTTSDIDLTMFFNNQAFHSIAISMSAMGNALLQFVSNRTLDVTNHPLPRTAQDKLRDQQNFNFVGFIISFDIVFGMSFLASTFAVFLIKERAVKAKHLQFTSGVNFFTFWSATFCWDIINYMMPVVCILITFLGFNVDAYTTGANLGEIALLFLLYGCAMLPFMYLCSLLFTVPATGYVWLTVFNILSGEATMLAVTILSIPTLNLTDLADALEWIFLLLLPNYGLGQGLNNYYMNYKTKEVCQTFCPSEFNEHQLGWESTGIGRMLAFLAIQSVLYSGILFLLESELAHRLLQHIMKGSASNVFIAENGGLVREDGDVATERARIANTNHAELSMSETLVMSEITKVYDIDPVVNGLSVGIPAGECFGLLGINGAGKTTTFKMLTGDETVSSGTAYLSGHSVISEIERVHQNLGYCPQFDALIDQMTGRETLYMYARLRGIHSNQIQEVVDDLLVALMLTEHADKLVYAYSGGNKRKLSTAIALVGNPNVVFLDEPTTGMDPMARRHLWDTLCSIREAGRTLVLTSHSMEECEALCTRLAIMVNGEFKCLGSPQHLKNKFGEGFSLLASVAPANEGSLPDTGPLMRFIEQTFPGSVLKDVHQGQVHYHVTDTTLKWAHIFGTMEKAKNTFNIENYSVSQTTLEQVFVNFARAQVPPEERTAGWCECACCLPCRMCCCRSRSRPVQYQPQTNETTDRLEYHF